MRSFAESDFTRVDGKLLISDASYLGFPPGLIMREFQVTGLGHFSYKRMVVDSNNEPMHFAYENTDGVQIEVFAD